MQESTPRSILIIRPSALGDVCRTVPVLSSLRAAWPDARIDWLVQQEFTEVVASHPALDSVVSFPRSRLRGAWRSPSRALRGVRWASGLRKHGWDLVLDCQGLARSALFTRCTGARRRIGFADAREFGWIHYTTRVRTSVTHAVDRMMSLVDDLGIPRVMDMDLHASDDAIDWWSSLPDRPAEGYAVFAPRSRWPSKEWPAKRWVELAHRSGDLGLQDLVFVGSPAESSSIESLASEIMSDPSASSLRVHVLAGKTTVGQLMAVIRGSRVVVASDSAALHMAVGFRRPMVALFGPTDPEEVGPYGCLDSVLRDPSATGHGHDYRSGAGPAPSMLSLGVDEVFGALSSRLGVGA
ncbi:MAG: glycosyltransferase family 9 protein [Phycisphaerales bacterium]|nr:glycosyltransferase family 9 protein [Phycisphaerales bacterium]